MENGAMELNSSLATSQMASVHSCRVTNMEAPVDEEYSGDEDTLSKAVFTLAINDSSLACLFSYSKL
jgi:hypothetical protein